MLKKILQVSSLVFALAMGGSISANASGAGGNEEDFSAPIGSFTSDMPVPANPNYAGVDRRWHHERVAMRFKDEGHRVRHTSENSR